MADKTEAEFRAHLDEIDGHLSEMYAARRRVMEQFAAAFPPVLPAPRYRTERQARVASCPRCGLRLDSDEPGAKI